MLLGLTPAIFAAAESIATGSLLAMTSPSLRGWMPETVLASMMQRSNFMALFTATIISPSLG